MKKLAAMAVMAAAVVGSVALASRNPEAARAAEVEVDEAAVRAAIDARLLELLTEMRRR